MTKTIQLLRGTTAQNAAFTGASGEVTVDTQTHELRVHDGSTAGGHIIYTKSDVDTALSSKADAATTYTKSEVDTALSGKANTDMDNLSATGKNIGNWSSNTTKSITNISQDIKLELDTTTHTITLKAGSKVYIPNGFEADGTTPHFDTITITTDFPLAPIGSYSGSSLLYLLSDGSGVIQSIQNVSGTTAPSNGAWYDLNTNLIKSYSGGSDTGGRFSLPIAIATRTSGNWTSIDRIFNGFGRMDKTPFALPNVYGLVPDGRNPDGTLRNIVAHTESVLLGTTPNGAFIRFKLSLTSPDANGVWTGLDYKTDSSIYGGTPTTNWYYDSKTNYWTYNGDRSYNWVDVCWCFSESNSITLFGEPETLEITDTNDKTFIGHQAMPSDKYATLTFGASGTTYKICSDGYLVVNVNLTANTYFAIFKDNSNDVADLLGMLNAAIGQNYSLCIPIYAGQQFRIQYSGTPTWRSVRFYYSQGGIA